MKTFPRLNLPSYKFKVRTQNSNDIYIWDIVRNKWLLLTPEEWVRQHIIYWFIDSMRIDRTSIVCEYPVNINGLSQRADIVVFENGTPRIIVECKAPEIPINRDVFTQVSRYNSVVGANFVILSNGLKTLCFEYINGEYKQIDSIDKLIHYNQVSTTE